MASATTEELKALEKVLEKRAKKYEGTLTTFDDLLNRPNLDTNLSEAYFVHETKEGKKITIGLINLTRLEEKEWRRVIRNACVNKVSLFPTVGGYLDDTREVCEIPEARAKFRKFFVDYGFIGLLHSADKLGIVTDPLRTTSNPDDKSEKVAVELTGQQLGTRFPSNDYGGRLGISIDLDLYQKLLEESLKNFHTLYTCDSCKEPKLSFRNCPCHQQKVCGPECQKKAWSEHKKTCTYEKA